MVFLEAAACGKPVIAGLDGGTGAAVIDGETGFRVSGADLPAVTGALERLLSDPGLAVAMGAAALRRAQKECSWERVAQQTILLSASSPTTNSRKVEGQL